MTETLLDRAIKNYGVAKTMYNSIGDDDIYINWTGYLLQQSTELCIKHMLEVSGIDYPLTHNISKLVSMLSDKEKILFKPIMLSLDGITSWEAKTRYVKNFRLEFDSINLIMPLIKEVLDNVYDYYKMNTPKSINPIDNLKYELNNLE